MQGEIWAVALAVVPAVISALISWWYNHRFLGVTQFREHEKELQEIRMKEFELMRGEAPSQTQVDLYDYLILNAYESFCGSYLYGIINRGRFEMSQKRMLQNLLKDDGLKQKISQNLRSYPCLREVYRKWGFNI